MTDRPVHMTIDHLLTARGQHKGAALSLAARLERYAQQIVADLARDRPTTVNGKSLRDMAGDLAEELRAVAGIDELSARLKADVAALGQAYPELTAIFDNPAALVAAVAEAADTVDPAEHVTVLADEPENRVLEAAAAGRDGGPPSK
jgi:hypothetical protein